MHTSGMFHSPTFLYTRLYFAFDVYVYVFYFSEVAISFFNRKKNSKRRTLNEFRLNHVLNAMKTLASKKESTTFEGKSQKLFFKGYGWRN